MLVVMKAQASDEQVRAVCEKIGKLGYRAHPMPGATRTRKTRHNGCHDFEAGDDVPRKGRARRFREARELKQGYDDGLFREGSGTLADLDSKDF